MIDNKKLKELIKLMVDNDLTELDLQGEGERVTLKRGRGEAVHYVSAPPMPAHAAHAAPGAPPALAGAAGGAASGASGSGADAGLIPIASPMVGTFYSAPSPDAKPYINVGDSIGPETVVCLIEAMKVFNEIKAEVSGKIEKVMVTSGQAVEFGQPLFMVRPA